MLAGAISIKSRAPLFSTKPKPPKPGKKKQSSPALAPVKAEEFEAKVTG
jgi:hypothetical protein